MGGIDFLVNAVAGVVANAVVSGVVGMVSGVGAAIAFHPLLIATGVLVGGAAIAFTRSIAKSHERPSLTVINGGLCE